MDRKPPVHDYAKARKLRSSMSLPEVLLWNHLRKKPMGVKFRRQHPVATM
jgi:very-short-patch-repair endonuclease